LFGDKTINFSQLDHVKAVLVSDTLLISNQNAPLVRQKDKNSLKQNSYTP